MPLGHSQVPPNEAPLLSWNGDGHEQSGVGVAPLGAPAGHVTAAQVSVSVSYVVPVGQSHVPPNVLPLVSMNGAGHEQSGVGFAPLGVPGGQVSGSHVLLAALYVVPLGHWQIPPQEPPLLSTSGAGQEQSGAGLAPLGVPLGQVASQLLVAAL